MGDTTFELYPPQIKLDGDIILGVSAWRCESR